jgi:hypothetical protein
LLCHVLLFSCATGTPISTELREGRNYPTDIRLNQLLNNKGMCGGDMAGGMIGPDCKPPKVRQPLKYK